MREKWIKIIKNLCCQWNMSCTFCFLKWIHFIAPHISFDSTLSESKIKYQMNCQWKEEKKIVYLKRYNKNILHNIQFIASPTYEFDACVLILFKLIAEHFDHMSFEQWSILFEKNRFEHFIFFPFRCFSLHLHLSRNVWTQWFCLARYMFVMFTHHLNPVNWARFKRMCFSFIGFWCLHAQKKTILSLINIDMLFRMKHTLITNCHLITNEGNDCMSFILI